MVANERKSRKRSAASSPSLPEPVVFFTDANLGRRIVPEALRAAGEEVRIHDEIFPPATHDRVWLRAAGEKRWIVLTKDSKIRYRRNEVAEFRSARVRVFVLALRLGFGSVYRTYSSRRSRRPNEKLKEDEG
jgi:PIN like domain